MTKIIAYLVALLLLLIGVLRLSIIEPMYLAFIQDVSVMQACVSIMFGVLVYTIIQYSNYTKWTKIGTIAFKKEHGDPIKKQKEIESLQKDIVTLANEISGLEAELSSPKNLDDKAEKIEEASQNLLNSINQSSAVFSETKARINELSNMPASVTSQLETLTSGISGLLEHIETQPEKVQKSLNNNASTDSEALIAVGVALARFQDADEEGDLESWETTSIELLMNLKESLGISSEKFLLIAWTTGKVVYDADESGTEYGEELYEAVEKILPNVKE